MAEEVAGLRQLDVLVHAAATGVIRPALETDDKHWDWTLAANARALLSLTRAAAPSMPSGSSIVGISSLGSVRVLENYTLVGASKAALEALVRYLAVELAAAGSASTRSPQASSRRARSSTSNKEAMSGVGMLARSAAWSRRRTSRSSSFLCSPDADMIRGQTVVVDGGWSLLTTISSGA